MGRRVSSWQDDVLAKRAHYMREIDALEHAGKITAEHAQRARMLVTREFIRRACGTPDAARMSEASDQNIRDFIVGRGIQHEFAQAVLEILQKWRAEMHGCPIWKVEPFLDGTVAIWFKGPRDGIEWQGALRFNAKSLLDYHVMGDPQGVAQLVLQMLDDIKRRGPQKLIEKAN